MKSNPGVLVNSTTEGIYKVKNENYAYLLESTTNEYARQRDCDLVQVGDLLDTKSYGIGLQKGSKWTKEVSRAILLLQENAKIRNIYDKWWKQTENVKNCDNIKNKAYDLTMKFENIRGIFFILFIGLFISVVFFLAEIFYSKWRKK